jgi:hypothetical protein
MMLMQKQRVKKPAKGETRLAVEAATKVLKAKNKGKATAALSENTR